MALLRVVEGTRRFKELGDNPEYTFLIDLTRFQNPISENIRKID
jgi:hypothetical protein